MRIQRTKDNWRSIYQIRVRRKPSGRRCANSGMINRQEPRQMSLTVDHRCPSSGIPSAQAQIGSSAQGVAVERQRQAPHRPYSDHVTTRINIWRSCRETTNVQTNILIRNGPQLLPTHNLFKKIEELKGMKLIPQQLSLAFAGIDYRKFPSAEQIGRASCRERVF